MNRIEIKRAALIQEIRELRPQGESRKVLDALDIFTLTCRLDVIRNDERRAACEQARRARQEVGCA